MSVIMEHIGHVDSHTEAKVEDTLKRNAIVCVITCCLCKLVVGNKTPMVQRTRYQHFGTGHELHRLHRTNRFFYRCNLF